MNKAIEIKAELVSGKEQVLEIGLNTVEMNKGITDISKLIEELRKLSIQVTSTIANAFMVSFHNIKLAIDDLKLSFDSLSESIRLSMEQYSQEEVLSQLVEWILGLAGNIAAIGGFEAVGAGIIKLLGTIGIEIGAAAAGWIGIAVAAAVAAIGAIIIYWDEISLFFTETLPQMWSQFLQWFQTAAGPVAEIIGQIVSTIGGWITECWNGIMTTLSGAVQWITESVVQPVTDAFETMGEWLGQLFGSLGQTISDIFYNIGVIVSGCWEVISKVWENAAQWFDKHVIAPVAGFFTELWSGIIYAAKQVWEGIKTVFSAVAEFFGSIFSSAWEAVVEVFSTAGSIFEDIKEGVLTVFKTIVNGLIDGINAVVKLPFDGINGAIKIIRDIEIVGLHPFSGLKTINVPQIPHLAQGAVLPANRPFLAVVGDQRHGSNIEAPLATIQEAVAMVMDDHISAMMAGFQALLQEQQATRRAIEGIQIGDTVIGEAALRYNSKMVIVNGS